MQENGGRSSQTQLRDAVKQNVVRILSDLGTQGSEILPQGILDGSWYRRLVRLGTHEDLPVLTFTTDEQLDFVAPGDAYLKTIALGLMESWHGELSKDEIIQYLADRAQWSVEDVAALIV